MSGGTARSLAVGCPTCGERLRVRAEDVGKRGKCRKCGAVFRIGGKADGASEGPKPSAAALDVAKTQAGREPVSGAELEEIMAPRRAASVTFPCSLCETRITAPTADVGKTVKCPDCGRANVIPEPSAKPQAAKTPAAMSGEQFDLWGVDEAADVAEIAARTRTLHPVPCGLCQTLMYATDEQVGTKLKCPDCGTLTLATARALEKPRADVIVPDGEEYQLDEASAPPPRPVYRPIGLRAEASGDAAPGNGEDRGGESGGGGESSEARRRALDARLSGETEQLERPRLPRVPLVQGVGRMLLTSEILSRWAALSIFLMLVVGMLSSIVTMDMGGYAAFYIVIMFAGGSILAAVWALAALPLSLMIVTESSEGNDRLHDPPNWLSMEFGEAFFVVVAAAVSAFPAWLTLKVSGELPVEGQAAIVAGTWLFFFPIVLLSNLEQSSAFAVLSPRLLSSLVRCAGPWLLFYVESLLLAAAALAALEGIARGPWWLVYLAPFVAVAWLLFYMRLIGRLAWWLAETMPEAAESHAK